MLKKNVAKFSRDMIENGEYTYTSERLSSSLAMGRISEEVFKLFQFKDTSVFDIGCGDGKYTFELAQAGCKRIVAIDPSSTAIDICKQRAKDKNLSEIIDFQIGDVYDLHILPIQLTKGHFKKP